MCLLYLKSYCEKTEKYYFCEVLWLLFKHSLRFLLPRPQRQRIGLYQPLGGITDHKYELLHFLTTKYFYKDKKALAFNWDKCCHLVIFLQLIHFHLNQTTMFQACFLYHYSRDKKARAFDPANMWGRSCPERPISGWAPACLAKIRQCWKPSVRSYKLSFEYLYFLFFVS